MYSGSTPGGGRRTFGTSGLLYRSNKLMFDRETFTLWSNLTAEPVVGRLADGRERLEILPVTRTTWGEWRRAHPQTTVMVLDSAFGERWGFRYRPGEADRARAGVRFPMWQKDARIEPRAEVYAVRLEADEGAAAAKAYPVDVVLRLRVIHDRLGGTDLVVLGDREGGAVRAYRAGGHQFRRDGSGGLVDESGRSWRVEEERLVLAEAAAAQAADAAAGEGQAAAATALERVPGHRVLWFAWYGFFPETELYGHERP